MRPASTPHFRPSRKAIPRTFCLAAAVAVGCGVAAVDGYRGIPIFAPINQNMMVSHQNKSQRMHSNRWPAQSRMSKFGEEPLYNDDDDFQADLRVSACFKERGEKRRKKKEKKREKKGNETSR